MIFQNHKANLQHIPDELLVNLALNIKVDYCAKVLRGERLLYLNNKLILNTYESIFNHLMSLCCSIKDSKEVSTTNFGNFLFIKSCFKQSIYNSIIESNLLAFPN